MTLLIAYAREDFRQAINIGIDTLRKQVDVSMNTMKRVQRTSLMSRRAYHCLTEFLGIFDSLVSDQTPSASVSLPQSDLIAGSSSISQAAATLQDDDYSLWITQAANEFLSQYSDNFFFQENMDVFDIGFS